MPEAAALRTRCAACHDATATTVSIVKNASKHAEGSRVKSKEHQSPVKVARVSGQGWPIATGAASKLAMAMAG
eukprot:scaffold1861_cov111-Isochrysis_galbana.AAC.15